MHSDSNSAATPNYFFHSFYSTTLLINLDIIRKVLNDSLNFYIFYNLEDSFEK